MCHVAAGGRLLATMTTDDSVQTGQLAAVSSRANTDNVSPPLLRLLVFAVSRSVVNSPVAKRCDPPSYLSICSAAKKGNMEAVG